MSVWEWRGGDKYSGKIIDTKEYNIYGYNIKKTI